LDWIFFEISLRCHQILMPSNSDVKQKKKWIAFVKCWSSFGVVSCVRHKRLSREFLRTLRINLGSRSMFVPRCRLLH
jgi:hypothetical protein